MSNNPELIRQMVQNPLVQQLMANPGVITELITTNPQTKDWLKVIDPIICWRKRIVKLTLVHCVFKILLVCQYNLLFHWFVDSLLNSK